MIRTLSLASVVAVGLVAPALASDQQAAADAGTDPAAVAEFTAALSNHANAQLTRKMLQKQGYTQVSELSRDEKGRWVGNAVKDGRTVGVVVQTPLALLGAPSSN